MNNAIRINKQTFDFASRTFLMGVLNITPDSFSDGGKFYDFNNAVERGLELINEGSDILDIGGESTRPGSVPLEPEEEKARVIDVIKEISRKTDVPISIDSYKPEVIEKALNSGAGIINDITGLQNKNVRKIAAEHKATVVVMHMQGTPQIMQENPVYDDVVDDIIKFFRNVISLAEKDGISKDKIIIDPGIGFGKTLEHNLLIINRLNEFKQLDVPIMIGTSRKSFLGAITGADVDNRLYGTIASTVAAVMNGASIVRVHDVSETKQALQVIDRLKSTKLQAGK